MITFSILAYLAIASVFIVAEFRSDEEDMFFEYMDGSKTKRAILGGSTVPLAFFLFILLIAAAVAAVICILVGMVIGADWIVKNMP